MKTNSPLYGGIEGGGTKFICAVGSAPDDLRDEIRIPTTTPAETMQKAIEFFQPYAADLAAIGFSCFGPLDPNVESPAYGRILSTPKAGWSDADVLGMLKSAFRLPIAFDTDVNGAALGEWTWGAAQGLKTFIYLTIGTGIGGGAFVEGKLLHGLLHPEMGHIPLPHDKTRDPFAGACPFHGDCFEGLASGPAMEKRWGQKAEALPREHPAWGLEAEYIASALTAYIYAFSPQRIILGGGIGQAAGILSPVQEKTRKALNHYVQSNLTEERIAAYIVPPALGSKAGVLGSIALARSISQP
ncbi:MAG: ROK family protein [Anaerolineales bacterium]